MTGHGGITGMENALQNVTFASKGSTAHGYLSLPELGSGPGGAVDYLLGHDAVTSSTIGAVGFCMGGGFVLVLAAQQGDKIGAAVPFYGVLGEQYPSFEHLSARVLGHFGDQDEMQSTDQVRELAATIERQSGRKPDFRFYPAGHAFFYDQNLLGTYDPDQAAKAWDATVSFLRAQLTVPQHG